MFFRSISLHYIGEKEAGFNECKLSVGGMKKKSKTKRKYEKSSRSI
jgi:hypothetical protein